MGGGGVQARVGEGGEEAVEQEGEHDEAGHRDQDVELVAVRARRRARMISTRTEHDVTDVTERRTLSLLLLVETEGDADEETRSETTETTGGGRRRRG